MASNKNGEPPKTGEPQARRVWCAPDQAGSRFSGAVLGKRRVTEAGLLSPHPSVTVCDRPGAWQQKPESIHPNVWFRDNHTGPA